MKTIVTSAAIAGAVLLAGCDRTPTPAATPTTNAEAVMPAGEPTEAANIVVANAAEANTDQGNTDHGNTDHGNTDHGNTDH